MIPGVGWGRSKEINFSYVYGGKKLLKNHWDGKLQIQMKASGNIAESSMLKSGRGEECSWNFRKIGRKI
jgi:hypothetical protein